MVSRREKILQKLNPKLLKITPKLSGNAGSFIDLDSKDSLEEGAKNLMIRFFRNQDLCEKNKRNATQNVSEVTISSAKYNENNEICELISERLILPFTRNDADDVSEKPGKRLQKLKMELQEKMSAKWEEEYRKRVSENKLHNELTHKHKKKCSDDDEDDDDGDDEDACEDDSNNKETSEAEEKDDICEEVQKVEGEQGNGGDDDDMFGDDKGLESDKASDVSEDRINEDNEFDHDIDDDDDDGCSLVPAYQPGGGMLYGGSELTQTDDGLPQNLLSPSLRLSMSESFGSKLSSEFQSQIETTPKKAGDNSAAEDILFREKYKLFSQKQNDSFDLSEAFELCSGKFPDAEDCSEALMDKHVEDSADSYEDSFQNKFEEEPDERSQPLTLDDDKASSKTRKNIIVFEDSEAEEEKENDVELNQDEDSLPELPRALSDDEENEIRNAKKTRKNLHFSDEEDGGSDCEGESDKEDDDDAEERSVHYDSEENEIINPREFIEKEAELSGEEWSGDEDERGLDEFDAEEGDADKLDDDKVRSQLEKIHIRRILDDDAREVRLIQEILFEDGDLYSEGKQRERKFKWKNLGAFEQSGNEGEAKEEGGNSSEDEAAEEEEMRKIRHEKELFLMTKKKNGDVSSDDEIVEDFQTIKVTSIKTSIRTSSGGDGVIQNSKTVTDVTKITKPASLSISNSRGSFLMRNEQFLSRLAKATSGVTDNVLGPKSSKNFVFSTKSPEKKNPDRKVVCKRQVEDSETCSKRDKKMRLLPPEIDTGPSILDLLV